MTFKIDNELKNLIPPLTIEEKKQLKENLLKEGIRDALVLGEYLDSDELKTVLIDGHNRLEIANNNGLLYDTKTISFDNYESVKEWMILHQFGRRNLQPLQRIKLALQLEDIFRIKGKENQAVRAKNKDSLLLSNLTKEEIINTRKEASNLANVSTGTYYSGKQVLENTNQETQDLINNKLTSISAVQNILKETKKEVSEEQIEKEVERRVKEQIKKKEEEKQNRYAKVAKKIKANKKVEQSKINNLWSKEYDIKLGDIYTINDRHKLIIWDSFDVEYIKSKIPKIDIILTDPPYGISYKSPSGNGLTQRGNYKIIEGDNKSFEPSILFEYCKNVITWGANHYANKLENSAGWLVWDKRDGTAINLNSDCELAWCNMLGSARLFHHTWNGMIKASERKQTRIHPTQKPVALFNWCLEIVEAGINVLDLFSGSGATLVACEETKRNCFLVENDFDFAAASLKRFENLGYKIKKNEDSI